MENIIRDNDINEVYHLAALLSATGEKTHNFAGKSTWMADECP